MFLWQYDRLLLLLVLLKTVNDNEQCTMTLAVVERGGRPFTTALQRTSAPSSCVVAMNVDVPCSVTLRTTLRPRRPPTVTHHDSASSSRLTGSPEATGGRSWTVTDGGGWPPTATHRNRPGLFSTYTRLDLSDGSDRDMYASRNEVMFSTSLIIRKSTFAAHNTSDITKPYVYPKSKNKEGKTIAKDQFKAKVQDYNDSDASAFIHVVLPIPYNENKKSERKI